MSTQNTGNPPKALASVPDQKRYRTFEDLEFYQVARELREESPAYGLTEDQLDELLADPVAPPVSTLQCCNAATL